jgi:hypothetical protein
MLHDLDLYREYYEGSERGVAQWQLIFADDPAEIKTLEGVLKMTQADAVDGFIEDSFWKDDLILKDLVGKKRSADERRHWLRVAYLVQNSKVSMQTDYSLLTPLENNLFKLVWEMEKTCKDEALKKRAGFVLKDAARVADRAKERLWKETEGRIEKEGLDIGMAVDATGAETLEDFADIVAKRSPELGDALRRDIKSKKKVQKKARSKHGKQ